MLRNVLFASAILSVTGSCSLFAAPKAAEDPAKPAAQQDQAEKATNDQATGDKAAGDKATNESRSNDKSVNERGDKSRDGHSAHDHAKHADHAFATCVALGNQEEVALGQIGTKKAEHEEVKKFAAMLVADHHKYLTKLQKFAPEATKPGYLDATSADTREVRNTDARNTDKNAVQQAAATEQSGADAKIQPTAGTRDGDKDKAHVKMAQVEREVALECLKSSKEKLDSKTGAEFDKCFMGQQIAMHAGMRAKLIVFQRHASPELAEVLAAGQKKTEEHLAMAEEIMKSLDSGSASTTSAKAAKAEKSE